MTAPDIDLDAIEAAALDATPGPWSPQEFYSSGPRRGVDGPNGECICASYAGSGHWGDFEYIAAANPAVVLEIVRRLRAAEAHKDNFHAVLNMASSAAAELGAKMVDRDATISALLSKSAEEKGEAK